MSMKRRVRRLMTTVIISMMLALGVSICIKEQSIKAAENPKDLADRYFNTSLKYLYLGEPGGSEFDFKITSDAKEAGATYYWYVKEDKGTRDAVTIDHKTGRVTARSAGTAYIRCKITRTDGSVLRPEAKVIVRNAITEVKISGIPENNTVLVGRAIDFSYKIINTAAGKGMATEATVHFEIADDSSWLSYSTENGVVTPNKEGEFNIRVVCFHSEDLLERWLIKKEANASYITAVSEWVTINVVSPEGQATAASQEQLDELLKAKDVKQINLIAEEELVFTIPRGDYSDKNLVVSIPNSEMNNYGLFNQITIKDMIANAWEEHASGNSIIFNNEYSSLHVNYEAKVSHLLMDIKTRSGIIVIDGVIETISFNAPDTMVVVIFDKYNSIDLQSASMLLKMSDLDEPPLINYNYSSAGSNFLTYGTTFSSINNKTGGPIEITVAGINYVLTSGSTILGNLNIIGYISKNSNAYTPELVTPVIASKIEIGQTLSSSILSGTFNNSYNSKVEGTLSWNDPNIIVKASGIYAWTFTPNDRVNYNTVKGIAEVTAVVKEVPQISRDITASDVNSGDTLSESILRGLFVNSNQIPIPGKLTWNEPTTVLNSTDIYWWTFEPLDTVSYYVIGGAVIVTVND